MTTSLDEFAATSATANASLDTQIDPLASEIGTSTVSETPDKPSPAYLRMVSRWRRCRALIAGTDGIRAGGDEFTPRFDGETDDELQARVSLVALTNAFARTVKACVGMLLQKRPELGQDMPAPLKTLWESIGNVDGTGTHGAVITKQLATEAMIDGHAALLIDYPRVPNADTVDASQEAALGYRPYWLVFKAQDIYMTFYATVNGQRVLTLLVLREIAEELVGGFGIRARARYRVYRRVVDVVTYEIWTSPIGGGVPTRTSAPTIMRNCTAIPFALCIAGERLSRIETRPPLLDLADLNIEHHQIKTDIRNLESLAMRPTLKRVGYHAPLDKEGNPVPAPVLIGPKQVVDVPIEGDVSWFSPDITVLEPANQSLADVKAAMGAAGLAFIAPETRQAETAEGKRIDAAAQNASLATFASNLQDCLETAFQYTAQFMGLPKLKSGSITINTDFERTVMDPMTIRELGNLAINGKLSIDTLLALLERGRVLDDGFDREAELAKILQENTLQGTSDTPTSGESPTPPADSTLPTANDEGNAP